MEAIREGKRFLLATFLLALAALNTGNNLIYLILSLMLSVTALSIAILRINLSRLSLDIVLDHPVFAGQKTYARLFIENRKRFMTAYSMSVEAREADITAYCPLVRPKSSVKKEIKVCFDRRGLYRYGNFYVMSGFPLILFLREIKFGISREILVYPKLVDIDFLSLLFSAHEARYAVRLQGEGDVIHSIRPYRNGDDSRKIHWKASAKAAELLVKEYSVQNCREITLYVDDSPSGGGELFEKAVSLSGSICRYLLDEGYLVRVVTGGKIIPFGGGKEHLFRILDVPAVMKEYAESGGLFLRDSDKDNRPSMIVLQSRISPMNRWRARADFVLYADTE